MIQSLYMLVLACIGAGGGLGVLLFLGRKSLPNEQIIRVGVVFGILSVAFFLAPHPLIFFTIVLLTILFFSRKMGYAAVFFVVALALPGAGIPFLQLPGVNYVFDLSTITLLGLVGLGAAARSKDRDRNFRTTGRLLLMMLICFSISAFDRTSFTNDLRIVITKCVVIAGPFFAITSSITSKQELMDVIGILLAMAMVLAGVAVVGQLVHWNFYSGRASELLGAAIRLKSRGALLRMTSTFGQAYINFGVILASLAYFTLPLISKIKSRLSISTIIIFLIVGFLMSGSRTPFLAGAIGFGVLTLLSKNAVSRGFFGGTAAILILLLLQLTPFGEGLLSYLPLIGERGTDDYRVVLFERGMDILWDAPFFGDHLYREKLEDLRQGEGIIDIVNAYLSKALEHGLLYTTLFVAVPVLPTARAAAVLPKLRTIDTELAFAGSCIVAGIAVLMIGFTATSMTDHSEVIIIGLAAMAVSYNRIVAKELARHRQAEGEQHGVAARFPGVAPA